jgi:tetratricopeptide (TPR) repeat protein
MRFITCLTLFLLAALTLPTVASADFAINEYTQAIENSPEDVKYKFYLLRGKAYKDSDQLELALKDFNTSIMLDPSLTAYQYRGEVYFQMEDYTASIDDFTAALEINPSIDLFKLRGESYLRSEIYVLAFADGLKIIDMAPNEPDSYMISIEALEYLGDIKLAREQAFKVLSFDRSNRKANDFISKYPLQFVFIGESPVTIYIREGNYVLKNQASEIISRYKKGEKLDQYLKNKLNECTSISEKIKESQALLEEIWDKYFEEVRSLKIRSRKIHDELRNKYLEQSDAIEHDLHLKEVESEKCTEELVEAYRIRDK